MKPSLKKDDIGQMLERLGQAVSTGDLPGISGCYAFPALFISDEQTMVLEDADELEQTFAKGREWYLSQGIIGTRAELQSIEELTDLIAAVNVRWPGFNEAGKEVYSEASHYILQTSDKGPLVRVAISKKCPT